MSFRAAHLEPCRGFWFQPLSSGNSLFVPQSSGIRHRSNSQLESYGAHNSLVVRVPDGPPPFTVGRDQFEDAVDRPGQVRAVRTDDLEH